MAKIWSKWKYDSQIWHCWWLGSQLVDIGCKNASMPNLSFLLHLLTTSLVAGVEDGFRPFFFSHVKSIYIFESIHKVSRSNNNLEPLNWNLDTYNIEGEHQWPSNDIIKIGQVINIFVSRINCLRIIFRI